jgi:hypothetical protein
MGPRGPLRLSGWREFEPMRNVPQDPNAGRLNASLRPKHLDKTKPENKTAAARADLAKPLYFIKSSQGKIWCGREDSNFHALSGTATSTLRVYQFRHDRILVGPQPKGSKRVGM